MRDADLIGSCGRAWLLNPEQAKSNPATLCGWLVNRPGAHPHWQWWLVGLITLRDIPGIQPARKNYPEAEYELYIYSIDPSTCSSPEPDSPEGYPPLLPLDVLHQFHGLSEKTAKHLTEIMVQNIVAGRISPDQDYRKVWSLILPQTIQDLREKEAQLN